MYWRYFSLFKKAITTGVVYVLSLLIVVSALIFPLAVTELRQLHPEIDDTIQSELSPTVTLLRPYEVVVGQDLTLYGTGFGSTPGLITLNNEIVLAVEEKNWTDTQVVVRIPEYIPPASYSLTLHGSEQEMHSGIFFLPQATWATAKIIKVVPDAFEYIVQPGDNLFKIARDNLGAEGRYLEVLSLNERVLKDQNKLEVGLTLLVPNK